ncbi:MAG: hypothetical protein K5745_02940 [Saccharofermentans sp.]|nr:hypothetical protein [Saccharofermentans sp.]
MEGRNTALDTVIRKLHASANLWMVVGICQIIFGFWYLTPIFFGIWNIINANDRRKMTQSFRRDPRGLTDSVKSWKDSILLSMLLNFFMGALIGIIGCLYDYSITSYLAKHEAELRQAEEQ